MNLHEYQKRLANFIAYLIRIYSNPVATDAGAQDTSAQAETEIDDLPF